MKNNDLFFSVYSNPSAFIVSMIIIVLLLPAVAISNDTIQIGAGTAMTGTSEPSPININHQSIKSQWVYQQSEISVSNDPKLITEFGLYVATAPVHALPGFKIKMRHTTASDASSHIEEPFTVVYQNSAYEPQAGGFDLLPLTRPFFWNGIDNIAVEICFDPVPSASNSGTIRYYSESNGFRYIRSNNEGICGEETTTTSTRKPQATITLTNLNSNDAGIASIISPQMPFAPGQTTLQAEIKNFGNNTLASATINWSINGSEPTSVNWTGNLLTNQLETVSLGSENFPSDEVYDIAIWTSSPNGETDPLTSNDSIIDNGLLTSMAGTYTIGGSSPDFSSFQEAVDELSARGISEAVTINVRDGLYNEQVAIPFILGTSADNTITFQAESGNPEDVTLTFNASSTQNYTVFLEEVSHLKFQNITFESGNSTYSRVFSIGSKTSDITIENAVIKGIESTSSSSVRALIFANGESMDEINVIHNYIEGGAYGVHINGVSNSNASNILISGNELTDQGYTGVYFNRFENLEITNNIFFSTGSSYFGINLNSGAGERNFSSNRIYAPYGRYGIYNNSNSGTADQRVLISNNFISAGSNSTAYGIALNWSDRYMDIYHNNILITGSGNNSSRALSTVSTNNNLNIKNNNFINTGGGHAIYLGTINQLEIDNNNYFSTGSLLARISNNDATDLEELQQFTTQDASSLSVNPYFESDSSLYVNQLALFGAGVFVGIDTDIDGTLRNTETPVIGAHEYTPPANDAAILAINEPSLPFDAGVNNINVKIKNNGSENLTSLSLQWQVNEQAQTAYTWTGNLIPGEEADITIGSFDFTINQSHALKIWAEQPNGQEDGFPQNDTIFWGNIYPALNGNFTVGGSTPDFLNLTDATINLRSGGITGDVVFDIRAGSYNEQLVIHEFPRTDSTSQVTFRSETLDSTSVSITYGSSWSENFTILLNNVINIEFSHLTLASTNSSYATIIDMVSVENIRFRNNIFQGVETSSTSTSRTSVYSNSWHKGIEIQNNSFLNNSYAIYLNSGSNTEGILIHDNNFENQSGQGIYLRNHRAPVVQNNRISTTVATNSFTGIEIRDSNEGFQVSENTITANNGNYGMYIRNANGTSSDRGSIHNNFVHIESDGTFYGVYIYSADYLNFVFNNIHTSGASENSHAFYSRFGNNQVVLNNILANSAGGYSAYVNSPAAISSIDHNNYFATGANLGYWNNAPVANLTDWIVASGGDANSLDLDPIFVTVSDLHVQQVGLKGKGTPFAGITTDIDGEERDVTNPDIGADEFAVPDDDAGIEAVLSPVSPFGSGEDMVSVSLANFGVNTLTSVEIGWEVNNTSQPTVEWTGNLAAGESISVDLGNYPFQAGISHEIKTWTSLPNEVADGANFNDTTSVSGLIPALLGDYTIGGETPDYENFDSAINDLNTSGILDAVTFHVRSGTYNEQVIINAIEGSSSENTVTFKAETGDSTDVILAFNSGTSNNYIVRFDGASHVNWENMTLQSENSSRGRLIEFINNPGNITLSGNILLGGNNNSTSTHVSAVFMNGETFQNITIENSLFSNGGYGIYITPNWNNYQGPLTIRNNTFENQFATGIYLTFMEDLVIEYNHISTESTYTSFNGINIGSRDATLISSNIVLANEGNRGIRANVNGSSDSKGQIINNFIYLAGSSSSGYGLEVYNSSHVNIYHNNINLTTNHGSSRALSAAGGNNLNVINNNLIHSGNGYAFHTSSSSNLINSDHNNLYAPQGKSGYWDNTDAENLETWQSLSGFDINSLSVDPIFDSPTDLHVNQADLDQAGTDVGVLTDIDGEPRNNSKPDIGADEFIPLSLDVAMLSVDEPAVPFASGNSEVKVSFKNNSTQLISSVFLLWSVNGESQTSYQWTGELEPGESTQTTIGNYNFELAVPYDIVVTSSNPNGLTDQLAINDTVAVTGLFSALDGLYTIGGVDADFETFSQATELLNTAGVNGPVTFKASEGDYEEQFTIQKFPGASEQNRVTFTSESGVDSTVTIKNNSGSSNNYVVRFTDAEYITLKYITLEATNPTSGIVLSINGMSKDLEFSGNTIIGSNTNSTSTGRSVIYAGNEPFSNIRFHQNLIQYGSYGLYLYGNGNRPGITISENTITDQYRYGIYLRNITDALVLKNTIQTQSGYSSYHAIHLTSSPGSFQINQNRIMGNYDGYGIYITSSTAPAQNRSLISNNFIQAGNSNNTDGIHLNSSGNIDLIYNSINITSSNSSSYAFNSNWSQDTYIKNNIFASTSGARPVRFTPTSYSFNSDRNNFFTTGNVLADFGGEIANLASWQSQTGKDENSLSVDPVFESDSVLYTGQNALVGAAEPQNRVNVDIDDNTRDPFAPVIGAHELTTATEDASVAAIVSPVIPFAEGVNELNISLLNNALNDLNQITIHWIVNGLEQTPYQWNGELSPGSVADITIGDFNFIFGESYNITIYSSLPNGVDDQRPENDTLHLENIYAGLNGTYTIGSGLSDFSDFTSAIDALNNGGIAGNVEFVVKPGIYEEQLQINSIAGTSDENTITFRSETNDYSDVTLRYNSDSQDNFIVKMDNTQSVHFEYITFESINETYSRAIDLRGNLNNIGFNNNRFLGNQSTSTSTQRSLVFGQISSLNNFAFEENSFQYGSYAVYIEGNNNNSDADVVLRNNTFFDQYHTGAYLANITAPFIFDNTLTSAQTSNSFYGLHLQNCNEGITISSNKIYSIENGYGVYISSSSSNLTRSNIINNFVQTGGTGNAYGIFMTSSSRFNVFHNTLHVTGTSESNGRAFYLTSGSNNLIRNNIFHNSGGGYALYINSTGSISSTNYNNLFTTGANLGYWGNTAVANLADWQSTTGQDANSLSLDPVFLDTIVPYVTQSGLSASGVPIAEVSTDIDGNPRNPQNPSMGAVEFVPLNQHDAQVADIIAPLAPFAAGDQEVKVSIRNNGSEELTSLMVNWRINGVSQQSYLWEGNLSTSQEAEITIGIYEFAIARSHLVSVELTLPNGETDENPSDNTLASGELYAALNGSYSVGGSSSEFSSINQAINSLNLGGVMGATELLISNGVFNSNIHIQAYPGMHENNPVTFRSAAQDSTLASVYHLANGNQDNYTILLDGASYLNFEHLKLESKGSNYGRVIVLTNGATHNSFKNNIIKGVSNASSSHSRALLYSGNTTDNHLTISNNHFINGSSAIYLNGGNQSEIKIFDNIVKNQYAYGIYLRSQNRPLIERNEISSLTPWHSYTGLNLIGISNGMNVYGNKIVSPKNTGILLSSSSGTAGSRFLIANNFVSVSGSSQATGIDIRNTNFVDLFFNNINITSANASSRNLYTTGGQNINLANNILSAKSGGLAMYINTPSAISSSNHNNFHTTTSPMVYWNGPVEDLGQWQEITSYDNNSLSVDPVFYSDSVLYILQPLLFGAGTPLSAVPDDIDGKIRDSQNPAIGAHELEPLPNDIGPVAIASPLSDCQLSNQEFISIRIQNFGTNPQTNFDISYIYEENQITENIQDVTIEPSGVYEHTFTTPIDLSAKGDYIFSFTTDMSGDENTNNDTLHNIMISHHPSPVVQLVSDQVICEGESVLLVADGGDHYIWSTGETTSSILVTPDSSQTYEVTVENELGCSTTASVFVEVLPAATSPVIAADGDLEFCQGQSVTLTSDIEEDIIWSTGETSSSITIFESGSYSATHTNEFGCKAVSNVIDVVLYPVPEMEVSNPDATCPGEEISLNVTHGSSFLWSTGQQTPGIVVVPNESTEYTVEVSDDAGCQYELSHFAEVLQPEVPGVVSNMLPPDMSVDLSMPLSFSWAPAEYATHYDLYIWPENEETPEDPVLQNITTINTSFSGNLEYGQSFNWTIYARNACYSTPGQTQTFDLRELPDLVVDNIQINQEVFAGLPLDLSYTITNTGAGSTEAQPWKDAVYVSFKPEFDNTAIRLAQFNNQSYLNPGQSYTQTVEVDIPGNLLGEYYIYVKTDNGNVVTEISTENNTGRNEGTEGILISLPPLANLEAQSLNVGQAAFSGDTINVTYSAQNTGDIAASGIEALYGIFLYTFTGNSTSQCAFTERVWFDGIYLSQNPVFDRLDAEKIHDNTVRIRSENYDGLKICNNLPMWLDEPDYLDPGEEYMRVVPVEIPHQLSGTYYMHVVLNEENVFSEYNKNNNVITSQPIDIVLRPPPDLVVDGINIDEPVVSGESFTVDWTVKNQGANTPVEKNWRDAIYISEFPFLDDNAVYLDQKGVNKGDTLSADSQYTLNTNINIPQGIEGEYYLHVMTDANNNVFESIFENNNSTSIPITVQAGAFPDLFVSEANMDENTIAGNQASVNWTVVNQGEGTPKSTWSDRIYISAEPLFNPSNAYHIASRTRVQNLNPGDSYYNQIMVNIPAGLEGTWYVHVFTDIGNQVFEDGRKDNNLTTGNAFTIFEQPDVPLSDLSVTQSSTNETGYSGTEIPVSWMVENVGEGRSNHGSWTDKIFINSEPSLNNAVYLKNQNRNGHLQPGETYQRFTNVTLPNGISGEYYVIVMADANTKLNDTIRDNNISVLPVEVILSPSPDLVVESFEIAETIYSGQDFWAHYTITNQGEGPAEGRWTDRILISSTPDLSQSTRNAGYKTKTRLLQPGESHTDSMLVSIPTFVSGNRYLVLSADDNNEIYEHMAEENNLFALPVNILVPLPSDIIVQSIQMPPGNIEAGKDVDFEYTITNQGVNAAIGSLRDAMHVSSDQMLNETTDPIAGFKQQSIVLEPGESQARTINTRMPGVLPGDYHGIVRTNILGNVRETDLTNNTTVSDQTTQVSINELPVDVLVNTELNYNDIKYFQIATEPDKDLIITLNSDQSHGENEIFVAYDRVPDRVDFDFSHGDPNSTEQTVLVPSTSAGNYYLRLNTRTNFPNGQTVGILAQLLPFGIREISPSNVGQGRVTTLLTGAGFSTESEIYLTNGNDDVIAYGEIHEFRNSMQMYVRWYFDETPIGTYNLNVTNADGDVETITDGLTIEETQTFELAEYSIIPTAIAANSNAFYSFSFENMSNIDIPYAVLTFRFPLGTDLVNFSSSSNAWQLSQLYQNLGFEEGDDYIDDNEFRNVPVYIRDLAPNEVFSSSLVFKGFPESNFALQTEQIAMETAEFINSIASSAETNRQYMINNPSLFSDPDYEELLALTVTEEVFRDSYFEDYIGSGLVDAADTVGIDFECFVCDQEFADLAETTDNLYTYNPGSSPGLEEFTNLTFDPGESYLWDINRSLYWPGYEGPMGVAGQYPGWDLIKVNGTLDITSSFLNPFTFYMRSLSYTNYRGPLAGWYPAEDICWPVVVADQILGFDPDRFVVNSYYFEQYNQVYGGTFSVRMSEGSDTLFICFTAYTPGIGEDGVPGAPGVFCEPGSPGGPGGPGNGTIPSGRGGPGGDGGDCFAEGHPGGDGGQGGKGGKGGFGQDGGTGGDGGDGGYGGPDANGGNGGNGGDGGDGGPGGNGGQGGLGGDGGTGGIGNGQGGNGGEGGKGGSVEFNTGVVGGSGGKGGNAGAGPGGDGNPGPGGPGELPDGPHGPDGDPPPTCCPPPPTPPSPPDDEPPPPEPPVPPDDDDDPPPPLPPGEPDPPIPPPCCSPNLPDPPPFDDDPFPPDDDDDGFEPVECGQAPSVSPQDCSDRFKGPDPCANAVANCAAALAKMLARTCRFGPQACKIGAALGAARCALLTARCVYDRMEKKRKTNEHCRPVVRSCDPNDILGPEGYGDERFVSVNDQLGYTIRFENDPEFAQAPAQTVIISQQLDENIDPLSFRLGTFGFADYVFDVPADVSSYNKRLDLRDSLNIFLDVVAGVNVENNEIFWILTSIDPATGATPSDPFRGFLAINDDTGVGEGFVTYSVKPTADSETGEQIFAEAEIVFDINEPIITPEIFNTIDAVAPVSTMQELEPVSPTNIVELNWSADDDTGGSGVRDYYLYISENGESLTRLDEPLDENSYTFSGSPGITYGFAVRSRDNVLNMEPYKTVPDVSTTINPDLEEYISISSPVAGSAYCSESSIPISWNQFGIETISIEYSDDGGTGFNTIASGLDAAPGSYNWNIPDDMPTGDQYVIRITSVEPTGYQATSDEFQVISEPAIETNFSDTIYLCEGNVLNLNVTAQDGFTYQWFESGQPLEGETSNMLDVAQPGYYEVEVFYATNCSVDFATQVEFSDSPDIVFEQGLEFCMNESTVELNIATPSGGIWSGLGVENGFFNPSLAGEGEHYLVYTFGDTGECSSVDSVIVKVLPWYDELMIGDFGEICILNDPFLLNSDDVPAGGIYSGPGVTEGVFDPAIAGVGTHVITYSVTNECGTMEGSAEITVTETTPQATLDPFAEVCFNQEPFLITGGAPEGGVYSGPGVSNGVFDPQIAGEGEHTIVYSFSDNCGTSAAEQNISVIKSVPQVTGKEITLYLDHDGIAQLEANDINDGSFDSCSEIVLNINQDVFTCANLGENIVVLTATNEFGNSDSANVTITLADTIAPLVEIKTDITVQLGDDGTATITAEDLDNGSTDNCEITELTLDKYTFDENDIGFNTVTLTATDNSGNTAGTQAQVIVESGTNIADFGENMVFNAYPNPFRDIISFEFSSKVSGYARIEIYDLNGALISVVYEGFVENGQYFKLEHRIPGHSSGMVFYKLSIDRYVKIGRLMRVY